MRPGQHTSDVGHEQRDVSFRPIVAAGMGLLLITVVVFVGVRFLLGVYLARQAAVSPPANPLASAGQEVPPAPRLQTAPIQDLRHLRAEEDALLQTYAWVDRSSGTVRVPIERAIDLLVQRPLPSRSETGSTR